jgi:DNA repair protein SbcC/Rad50
MKINKIYLKNINSFKGEHTVDFTVNPLSSSGLFAIVGPTGAGKSTLLDAITLALFNRVPRFDKKISKDLVGAGGSILTRGEKECSVEVEYVSKSGTYISKWWININRNNNLNDYGMEIVEKESGAIITDKKTEVPEKNQRFIGLSYDQFVKSILLSQGEFAKFLKSGKDERGKLLEDITGMQIYSLLGKKAHAIFKEKGGLLTDKRQQKNRIADKLVSDEIEQKWVTEINQKSENIKQTEEKLELYKSKIILKSDLKNLREIIEQKEAEKLKVQGVWQYFELEKTPLVNSHEAAEPFREQIINLENTKQTQANLQNRLVIGQKELSENGLKLTNILQSIKSLTKIDVSAENALQSLQDFRKEVTELANLQQNQEAILSQQNTQIKEIIGSLKIPDLNSIAVHSLSEVSLRMITDIAKERENTQNEWLKIVEIDNIELLSPQKVKFDTDRKSFIELSGKIKEYSDAQNGVKETEKEEKIQAEFIEANMSILGKLQKKLIEIELGIEKLELEKGKLSKAFNFDKERNNLLKKDEPCPLCGSIEHPFLSHYANNYVEIDQQLINQKALQKEQTKQINELSSKVETARQIAKKELARKLIFEEKRQQNLIEIDTIKKALSLEKVGNTAWVEEQIKLKDLQINTVGFLEKSSGERDALRKLYKNIKEVIDSQSKNNEIKINLISLYSGNNINSDCDKLQQGLSENITKIKSNNSLIKDLAKEIDEKKGSILLIEDRLTAQIQSGGFKDFMDLKSHLLSPENAKALRDEREQLRTQIVSLTQIVEERKKELNLKAKQDNDSITLEDLSTGVSELQVNRTTVSKELEDTRLQLRLQEENKKEITKISTELEILEKSNLKWELLDRYIGDAEGKKFSTFAQGLTLSRLIALSNKRLSELSDRYLLDKPNEKEDDELMVLDQYMGNERRSVKTLSGGETFMISLSLALALSDLASRNVKLESLFIDEGFGTLDPETLETALCTLEKLQQEGQKNIGIISHVESIKERISTQVRLQKDSRGFSRIEVV